MFKPLAEEIRSTSFVTNRSSIFGMDIEAYATYQQSYTDDVPTLLLERLRGSWHTYLDLGCGDGVLLDALNKRGMFDGKSVFAVDLSETRMQLVKQINPSFTCLVDSADQVQEVQDGAIDVLVSTQVIEHVPSDERMVAEIHRLLKPGGLAYVSTVLKRWYGWYFYRCNGRWVLDPTHVREYTQESQMVDLFKRQGFTILQNKKTPVWRAPADLVLKKILKSAKIANHPFFQWIRKIQIPIPGYSHWEIVCQKI